MYYLDKNIEKLDQIFDQNKREGYLRLDLNENPEGLPQNFIDEVLKNVTSEFVAQYPETLEFTEVLADYLGTDYENYEQMKKKAYNHFPQDVTTQEKQK